MICLDAREGRFFWFQDTLSIGLERRSEGQKVGALLCSGHDNRCLNLSYMLWLGISDGIKVLLYHAECRADVH